MENVNETHLNLLHYHKLTSRHFPLELYFMSTFSINSVFCTKFFDHKKILKK